MIQYRNLGMLYASARWTFAEFIHIHEDDRMPSIGTCWRNTYARAECRVDVSIQHGRLAIGIPTFSVLAARVLRKSNPTQEQ